MFHFCMYHYGKDTFEFLVHEVIMQCSQTTDFVLQDHHTSGANLKLQAMSGSKLNYNLIKPDFLHSPNSLHFTISFVHENTLS